MMVAHRWSVRASRQCDSLSILATEEAEANHTDSLSSGN